MKPTIRFIIFSVIIISIACACTSAAPDTSATATLTPAVPSTETTAPTATATSEPSLTPTQTVLDLEILEWSEWPYASPADPSNTDTHVEVLIRNPNDFPVRVDNDTNELRFINAAGEVVFANPSPFFYIWEGEWMLPGETAALSACVCFWTSGMEKQEWKTLELVAPLTIATDIAYTLDVEVTAEFVLLEEVVHGYSGPGVATTLTNTSDQVLESIAYRVLARDNGGRYVGVATFGNAVASFTENISLQPGDTAGGLEVSEIDYVDSKERLGYEVAAIGIPAQAAAEAVLPSGTPLADWNGIPVMPGALGGEIVNDGYQFTIQADMAEITNYYETELSRLGFELELSVDENAGYAILKFQQADTTGMIVIAPLGSGLNGVAIAMGE